MQSVAPASASFALHLPQFTLVALCLVASPLVRFVPLRGQVLHEEVVIT